MSVSRIKFWGVRGSIPTPGEETVVYGGNTACVEVRAADQIIILDAGTGLRPLGRALLTEFADQPMQLTLLLTHTHWDHIQGLPFFRPLYEPRFHLRILGFEGAREGLRAVLSNQMEQPFFPIALNQLPANVEIVELRELEFAVGPVQVRSWRANHPGVCMGYRLITPCGDVVYVPDNELQSGAARSHSAGLPGPPASAPPNGSLIQFVQGAELLIHDAQYDRAEYPAHAGWGHGCVDDVVALALAADVKRLFLFHHDPDHDDRFLARLETHARQLVTGAGRALRVDAAREGIAVELPARTPCAPAT